MNGIQDCDDVHGPTSSRRSCWMLWHAYVIDSIWKSNLASKMGAPKYRSALHFRAVMKGRICSSAKLYRATTPYRPKTWLNREGWRPIYFVCRVSRVVGHHNFVYSQLQVYRCREGRTEPPRSPNFILYVRDVYIYTWANRFWSSIMFRAICSREIAARYARPYSPNSSLPRRGTFLC